MNKFHCLHKTITMKIKKYKYDVAFAFSKKDEHLADQINNLIHNKMNTFFYSKKLEEVDRPNRELKIMEAIGKQSKIVVVLFQKRWGHSPWTKIEEQTIRKRASKEGYDFLLFIPLDHPPIAPKYTPKAQIWEDLGNLGIKGAAKIIEARVQGFNDSFNEENENTERGSTQTDLDNKATKIVVARKYNWS